MEVWDDSSVVHLCAIYLVLTFIIIIIFGIIQPISQKCPASKDFHACIMGQNKSLDMEFIHQRRDLSNQSSHDGT